MPGIVRQFGTGVAAFLVAMSAAATATAGDVSIGFTPDDQAVALCDLVEIHLVVSSEDVASQEFDALDAILSWDPSLLELVMIDDSNSGHVFFISGFLPDPDGINADVTDGEALYTALAPPDSAAVAPPAPAELIVTTFVFRAVGPTVLTDLSLLPSVGVFGETRALRLGVNITGDISDTSEVSISACQGDFEPDGDVDVDDLLVLLAAWGPCPFTCCPEDLAPDGVIDVNDLLALLAFWGPCP